ncbi:MAG: hypothetical protein IT445_03600 [Phycisphaeraceae bacterium]|nr:hypothetical protein [Phycisphaeraceae bacterium]
MRDRLLGLLLSVLLSSFSFGDATDGLDGATADSPDAPIASLDTDASDTVMDDDGVLVKRLRPVTLADLNRYPAPVQEPAFDRRPTIWTLYHRDMTPLLVAGVWPLYPDVARLVISSDSPQKPTSHDMAAMLRVALSHCHQQGYLKLHLHAPSELSPDQRRVEAFGFEHSRNIQRHGTTIATYYRNLYHSPLTSADVLS